MPSWHAHERWSVPRLDVVRISRLADGGRALQLLLAHGSSRGTDRARALRLPMSDGGQRVISVREKVVEISRDLA